MPKVKKVDVEVSLSFAPPRTYDSENLEDFEALMIALKDAIEGVIGISDVEIVDVIGVETEE